jgi:hypothetical protein
LVMENQLPEAAGSSITRLQNFPITSLLCAGCAYGNGGRIS